MDINTTSERGPWKVFAVIGFIIGIVTMVFCGLTVLLWLGSKTIVIFGLLSYVFGLLGLIIGIYGIVMSILGKKSKCNYEKAVQGLMFSIPSTIISIIFGILGFVNMIVNVG